VQNLAFEVPWFRNNATCWTFKTNFGSACEVPKSGVVWSTQIQEQGSRNSPLKYLCYLVTFTRIIETCSSRRECTPLNSTRSSATTKSTARPSCLVGVLRHFLQENLLMANKPLLRNGPQKLPNLAK